MQLTAAHSSITAYSHKLQVHATSSQQKSAVPKWEVPSFHMPTDICSHSIPSSP